MAVRGSIGGMLRRQAQDVDSFLRGEAEEASKVTARHVERLTPIGQLIGPDGKVQVSGALRRSIEKIHPHRTRGGWRGGAFSVKWYSNIVEHGTRAHIILPKGRGTLRFVSDGAIRYSRRVHHPGTRGVFMFGRGILSAEAEFLPGAERRLQKWCDRHDRGRR